MQINWIKLINIINECYYSQTWFCLVNPKLQPNSSIFGLTKYIRQMVQYLVVYRISVSGTWSANEYLWSSE